MLFGKSSQKQAQPVAGQPGTVSGEAGGVPQQASPWAGGSGYPVQPAGTGYAGYTPGAGNQTGGMNYAGGNGAMRTGAPQGGYSAWGQGSQGFGAYAQGGQSYPQGGQIDHVLGRFSAEELELLQPSIDTAVEIISSFVLAGIDITMNQFNKLGKKCPTKPE